MNKNTILFLILSFGFSFNACAALSSPAAKMIEEVPVQNNGRIKPFQSFAREAVIAITGKYQWEGLSATQLVWQWIAKPEDWASKPIISISNKELRKEFSLTVIGGRIAPEVVLSHQPFLDAVREAQAKRDKKERLTPLEQSRLEMYEHAVLFQKIATGEMPGWIAHPEDPRAAWLPFQGLGSDEAQAELQKLYPPDKIAALRQALEILIRFTRENSGGNDLEKARIFSSTLSDLLESRGIILDRRLIQKELFYNRLGPFGWAWKFYLLAVWLMSFPYVFRRESHLLFEPVENNKFSSRLPATENRRVARRIIIPWLGLIFFASGFGLHLLGFVLRCLIAGRPPVTNMYESIIWVSWAVAFFSLILFAVFRSFLILLTSASVASFALILAQSFPAVLDPTISPLVPVLRSNYWLAIHVLTITLSYGAFALAWGLGHAVIFSFTSHPEKTENLNRLAQYLYRALQIGVILLATGTVLGGVWANYSWGRFWGWDPKETWALIALLGYLTVLHGRFAGWLDIFGLAVGSVIAFLGILMAWYGVNFVLAAGLHSYGFGGGGLPYVAAAVVLDLGIILWSVLTYKAKMTQLKM